MSFKLRRLYLASIAVAVVSSVVPSLTAQADSKAQTGKTLHSTPAQLKRSISSSAIKTAAQQSSVSISSSINSDQVSIRATSKNPAFSVQKLSSPPRLVVDIDGATQGGTRTVPASGSSRVSNVRIGAHPTKTRVVIDLKGSGDLEHNAQVRDGSVVVTLASKNPGANDKVSDTKPGDTEVARPVGPIIQAATESKSVPTQKAASASKLDLDEEVLVQGSSQSPMQAVAAPAKNSKETHVSASLKAQIPSATIASTEPSRDRAQPKTQALAEPLAKDALVAGSKELEPSHDRAQPKTEVFEAPGVKGAPVVVTKEQGADAQALGARSAPAADATVQQENIFKAMTEKKTSTGSSITHVSLSQKKGTKPSVVVALKGSPDFSLNRTAPSEYVLTLKDTSTSSVQRKQTLFGARDGGGIRSVRTTKEGQDTLVRIFTQPSSYLTARKSADGLVVEETQDLAEVARDIRAQLDPNAPAQDADKDPAKVQPVKAEEKVDANAKKEPMLPSKDGATAREVESKKQEKPTPPAKDELSAEKTVSAPGEMELAALKGDNTTYTGRLISLDLQDADIDSALRIIAEVSNLNIVAGDGVTGKVTLKLVDVPWDQALDVILKSHGLDKVLEGNVMRVAPIDKLRLERESLKQARVAEEELESLSVKYMRVSYAKASEIKALVETVLSERGSVAFDERSNQLIVKDVRKGLQNVTELVKKIDLRTPQILLETQIVEANRNLTRQLGSELGFQYIQSPATGNGTGLNFPAAVAVGGSVDTANPASITGAAFPIASSATLGSAVTMLFDSADGTRSLSLRLSQLEQEGQVRIISKPAVATTNNKPAEIKSVEKFRVKLPNGGLSIATGSGAQSTGAGNVATQTIEAGIVLNVTPQASPDYYILLDINAKSSTFGSREVDGIPNEIERSASSSVLVSSGQTFALGGIYKIVERNDDTGVPFFKDIPVLGTFFRKITTDNSDEELLFFITPRIVEGSFEEANEKANR